MATLTIRNVDEAAHQGLRLRAAENGCRNGLRICTAPIRWDQFIAEKREEAARERVEDEERHGK